MKSVLGGLLLTAAMLNSAAVAPIRQPSPADVRTLCEQVLKARGDDSACRICGTCGGHTKGCPAPTAAKILKDTTKEQP